MLSVRYFTQKIRSKNASIEHPIYGNKALEVYSDRNETFDSILNVLKNSFNKSKHG